MSYKLIISQYCDESLTCPAVFVKQGIPTFDEATKMGNDWIANSDNPDNYFFSVFQVTSPDAVRISTEL